MKRQVDPDFFRRTILPAATIELHRIGRVPNEFTLGDKAMGTR